ncbi:putative ankyrin-repeat protein [Savitreella phatthalungensis]
MNTVYEAALAGDDDLLRSLLTKDGGLAQSTDGDGRSALHWCCVSGSVRCARVLLSLSDDAPTSGAYVGDDGLVGSFRVDVNAGDSGGWTPLMIAVSAGHDALVQLLLSVPSIQPQKVNRGGQTALHFACSKNRPEAARAILDKVAALDEAESGTSATTGRPRVTRVKQLLRQKDLQGQLPLHRAAAGGNLSIVELVLSRGSPVDGSDAGGWTALHHACAESHGDCAAALVHRGADTDRTDADGLTPAKLIADDKVRRFLLQQCPEMFS